jgi:uncharacterized protein (TIGR01440 family)
MSDNYRGANAAVESDLSQTIIKEAEAAIDGILVSTNLKCGDIFVVGCSSSEILGSKIGKGSSYEAAKLVYNVFAPKLAEKGIFLAAQCCEHLNRAIVIERSCAEKYGYDPVAVIPQPKAGGSFATITFEKMADAVVVERISAHAGIDIGGTLIGMHLRQVAVPLRVDVKKIGEAGIICAYTRPKFIGGSRAVYE